MALRQSFYQQASHRPQTTAHLAQTMSLLGLNSQELTQEIEAALAKNPALELVEGRHCPNCGRALRPQGVCPICAARETLPGEEPLVFVNPPEDNYRSDGVSSSGESLPDDIPNADTEDLPTFVLGQIRADLEPADHDIAAHLLTSLNEDGLLTTDLEGVARYHYVPVTAVEAVQHLIMHADPIGVGASNPTQALLVQLEVLQDRAPDFELCVQTIQEGMGFLGKRHYGELAQLLGIKKAQAEEIADFITSNLSPYPARAHWGSQRTATAETPPTYQRPDIIIRQLEGDKKERLVVEVMWPLRGMLRVNPLFQKALKEAPEDKAEQWQIDLEQAQLLVKCLSQRNHTIVRLMQILAVLQRDYILEGPAEMVPLTRSSLADELGVHESTISRAVSGKSVQLPSGKIVPLAQFFDRSLHIRTALKEIINKEAKPLSDTKLAKELAKEGYKIARRTVAKYRNMEGILPAHMRKATAN